MANPAAAAQHQARGGDGAAGRPAAEQAQGTSSPRLLGAASAPAPAQQPRAGGRSWRVVGSPLAGSRRGGRGGCRRSQAVAVAGARRHRARGGAPWWRLLRCRAAGRAVAAPRLVRGCAAAAGFAMARGCFESHNSRLA